MQINDAMTCDGTVYKMGLQWLYNITVIEEALINAPSASDPEKRYVVTSVS